MKQQSEQPGAETYGGTMFGLRIIHFNEELIMFNVIWF
jgi:hypothetical protein